MMRSSIVPGLLLVMFAASPGPLLPGAPQYVSAEAVATPEMQSKWAAIERDILRSLRDFRGDLGFVIKDLSTGLTMAREPDKVFPAASMIKVPIMIACFKAAAEGRISLRGVLKVKPADKTRGSGNLRASPSGTPVTIEKLIELMVTSSDNTAANMLIDLLGFEYLGTTFRDLGLEHTNLSRKMMDFRSRRRGLENYTTPREMAGLLERIYRGTCVSPDISARCLAILKNQKVNDRIPRYLPRTVCVAHKTGLENGVCHDAGVVYSERGNVLICVLTQGNTGATIAKRMIARIASRVYRLYR
jgi:beta-lactamase class A